MPKSPCFRDQVRAIKPGAQRVFTLPCVAAMYSARSAVYQVAAIDGARYATSSDFVNKRMTVKREY